MSILKHSIVAAALFRPGAMPDSTFRGTYDYKLEV